VERNDRLIASNSNAAVEFQVSLSYEVGPYEVRRLTATADPEELQGAVIGSPLWRGETLVGIIAKHLKGARYQALRMNQIRHSLPAAPAAKGTAVYRIRKEVGDRVKLLQMQLKNYNRNGLTDDACATVQEAYNSVIHLIAAYTERDELGTWLAAHTRDVVRTYIAWNNVTKGPAGQPGREALWARFHEQRLALFGEIHYLEERILRDTVISGLPAISHKFDEIVLVEWTAAV
jgi:hypothetical protein